MELNLCSLTSPDLDDSLMVLMAASILIFMILGCYWWLLEIQRQKRIKKKGRW